VSRLGVADKARRNDEAARQAVIQPLRLPQVARGSQRSSGRESVRSPGQIDAGSLLHSVLGH